MTRYSSEETCVDGEATTDGMMMSAHWDFINKQPCSSNAENECPNWSNNPLDQQNGLVACLTSMWDEKNQPECSGCDTCDFPYSNCTNCVFNNGTVECGHYLNMKSAVLTKVACGFWSQGWYTQDFWP
jgi:hypothetical protein